MSDYSGIDGVGCVLSLDDVNETYLRNNGVEAPEFFDGLELTDCCCDECEQLDVAGPDDGAYFAREVPGCGKTVIDSLRNDKESPYAISNGAVFVAFPSRSASLFSAAYEDVDDVITDIIGQSELFVEADREFVRDHLCYVSIVFNYE